MHSLMLLTEAICRRLSKCEWHDYTGYLQKYDCTYSEAVEFIENNCVNLSSVKLLQELYDRSMIGCINGTNGYAHFKHRTSKKDAHEYRLDPTGLVIVHSGISINLRNR